MAKYPIFLELGGRRAVVIGAGAVAVGSSPIAPASTSSPNSRNAISNRGAMVTFLPSGLTLDRDYG